MAIVDALLTDVSRGLRAAVDTYRQLVITWSKGISFCISAISHIAVASRWTRGAQRSHPSLHLYLGELSRHHLSPRISRVTVIKFRNLFNSPPIEIECIGLLHFVLQEVHRFLVFLILLEEAVRLLFSLLDVVLRLDGLPESRKIILAFS